MTAHEEIKQETTLNILKGFVQNGVSVELISKIFEIPIQKIEEMISKLKNSNN
jgi:hypothetical protein